MLAGVDHHPRARHLGGCRVDGVVQPDVLAQLPPERTRPGQQQLRQLAVAINRELQRQRTFGVERLPAAESDLADLGPERAFAERLPAAAQLVVAQAALPQVDEFAQRTGIGQLTDRSLQQGRPGPAESAHVEHFGRPRPQRVAAGHPDHRWRPMWRRTLLSVVRRRLPRAERPCCATAGAATAGLVCGWRRPPPPSRIKRPSSRSSWSTSRNRRSSTT